MFREMRRKNREISIDMAKQLLQSSRRGVLAVNGDDGYPYAIPINYSLGKYMRRTRGTNGHEKFVYRKAGSDSS